MKKGFICLFPFRDDPNDLIRTIFQSFQFYGTYEGNGQHLPLQIILSMTKHLTVCKHM